VDALASKSVPYRAMVNALRKEGDELNARVEAMAAFTQTEGFKALDILDRHLFMLQMESAQAYLHLIGIRMARFSDAAKGVVGGASALGQKLNLQ